MSVKNIASSVDEMPFEKAESAAIVRNINEQLGFDAITYSPHPRWERHHHQHCLSSAFYVFENGKPCHFSGTGDTADKALQDLLYLIELNCVLGKHSLFIDIPGMHRQEFRVSHNDGGLTLYVEGPQVPRISLSFSAATQSARSRIFRNLVLN